MFDARVSSFHMMTNLRLQIEKELKLGAVPSDFKGLCEFYQLVFVTFLGLISMFLCEKFDVFS